MTDNFIPPLAFELIKSFEQCRLTAYLCPSKVWTIGWGTTGLSWIKPGVTITQEKADLLILHDVTSAAKSVLRLTQVPLNDNQFCALIDFVYNEGSGRYQASTVRSRLNRGEYRGAAEYLLKYIYGKGRILPGLVKRRRVEYNLFLS